MKMKKLALTSAAALPLLLSIPGGAMALDTSEDDYELKLLGKYLFFDKISSPSRQSCSSCHTPDSGWTNGKAGTNKRQVAVTGADPHTVGTLKPPSNAYAHRLPLFNECVTPGPVPCLGGAFWDGRAKGGVVAGILGAGIDPKYVEYLGPVADQAHASPFINPVEQGMPDIEAVCEHVKGEKYAALYPIAFDEEIDCGTGVTTTFANFALALSAYQHSNEVNPHDSRRDREIAGELEFTEQEALGRQLFYTPSFTPPQNITVGNGIGAGCAGCHNSESGGNPPPPLNPNQLYTDMRFHNIGTPPNPQIPGNPDPDPGVGDTMANTDFDGDHKTPTLRNVDKRRGKGFKKAYAHNGWFKSLESIVHFYNTRDVKDSCESRGISNATEAIALANDCWPVAEFPATQTPGAIAGNLQLSPEQEAALVAYMKTLTDFPTPKAPKPFNMKKFEKGQPF